MAQCSITKKWFPEDELVTFQGQIVSAEGKQILLDRLHTGVEASDEFVRPTVWRRFGCIFLDGIVLAVPIMFFEFAVMSLAISDFGRAIQSATTAQRIGIGYDIMAIAYLALGIIEIAYFSVLHGWKGRTVGKMAGNLKVINMDGANVSWKKATARAFAYVGCIFIYPIAALFGNALTLGIAALLVAAWALTDIILGLVDTQFQRTLHDRICGTRVIQFNR
jgi:uncharacterized RDD family membrane protein YckC